MSPAAPSLAGCLSSYRGRRNALRPDPAQGRRLSEVEASLRRARQGETLGRIEGRAPVPERGPAEGRVHPVPLDRSPSGQEVHQVGGPAEGDEGGGRAREAGRILPAGGRGRRDLGRAPAREAASTGCRARRRTGEARITSAWTRKPAAATISAVSAP